MKLSKARGEVYHFRESPLPFQSTFETPLKDLPHFVSTILSPFRLEKARVTIDKVVFEPKHLLKLLASHSIPAESCVDVTLEATGPEKIAALLEAALSDWVDFLFVPAPEQFVLYADHDEWTTFFAGSESELASITSAMSNGGFKMIADYERF
jgi:hypothetical protein